MGLTMAAELCAAFIEHGKPADTPAAVIEWATTRASVR
jgi:uroporphyrin-III C-methyltransferase/precorrin-2 dehydrogenase/sirohydrochlorin ferrochelatase